MGLISKLRDKYNKRKLEKLPSRLRYTIEDIERLSGVKLVYPNQKVDGSLDEPRYKELCSFGCSDIWDDKGSWLHRDCFSRQCHVCNFYPIFEKFNRDNKVTRFTEADFIKAFTICPEEKSDK
jgi:hypothetical protein